MPHLHHVGWQPLPPVRVKVAQAGCHAWHWHAVADGHGHHPPPAGIALRQLLGKLRVHQQVGQRLVTPVGLLDAVKESGADDAATLEAKQVA
jgi:hypothetical protein